MPSQSLGTPLGDSSSVVQRELEGDRILDLHFGGSTGDQRGWSTILPFAFCL
ncbi:MAG: hypothetical protein AAGD25_32295 [Cyanobacteria bacterium P01_F01_bin.150]